MLVHGTTQLDDITFVLHHTARSVNELTIARRGGAANSNLAVYNFLALEEPPPPLARAHGAVHLVLVSSFDSIGLVLAAVGFGMAFSLLRSPDAKREFGIRSALGPPRSE